MVSSISRGRIGYSNSERQNYLTSNININSKLNTYFNVSLKIVKLLEETTGNIFYTIGLGKDFRGMTPKAQVTKAKGIMVLQETRKHLYARENNDYSKR